MVGALQLSSPPLWKCRHQPPPAVTFTTLSFLSKQGHRFLSCLSTTTSDDPLATNRLIRKFIKSSSKSVALNALSHLLSPDSTHYRRLSSFAFPLYKAITEASWFSWNAKLAADVIALLDKQGQVDKAQNLVSETIAKLEFRQRDIALFYCNLIASHTKHKSKQGFSDSCARLKQLLYSSSSVYGKLRAYESMVGGLCAMDLPREAESLIEETRHLGLRPSAFEFKSLAYAYGKLGLLEDMKRTVVKMEGEGFGVDTVCSNMVLSSFGAHGRLSEMVSWLRRMQHMGTPLSIRTYNSVMNSCPMIMSMLQDIKSVPLSIEELMENLSSNEALLVSKLVGSSVLAEAMEWNSLEAKLDLHGMHLGSAYFIMLQWTEELQSRFRAGHPATPTEITVVCGAGKHSNMRGVPPVKSLVKEMMIRMKCPMRIDRKNVGCFVAKGRAIKDWLCQRRRWDQLKREE